MALTSSLNTQAWSVEDKAKEDTALMSDGLLYVCFSNAACTLRGVERSNEGRHRWTAQQKRSLDAHAIHAETSGEETEQILMQEHHQK